MTFVWPLALLALLAIPVVLAVLWLARRRRLRYAVRYTNIEVLAGVVERSRPWRRWAVAALFLASLATASVALARPKISMSVPREQATVVMVVDTSGSMMADDVKPSRIGAAKDAMKLFLEKLPPKFRVGIVAFSSEPQVVAPVTADRAVARAAIDFLFPNAGTAIGDAIQRALQAANETPLDARGAQPLPSKPGDGAPVSILLLSDGHQTQGFVDPLAAARRARTLGVPIYTIALGTPNGTISFNYGNFVRTIAVPPDPGTLRQISEITGGEFFAAAEASKLKAVYSRLGSKVGRVPGKREMTYAFSGGAAALLLAAGLLGGLWSQRLP